MAKDEILVTQRMRSRGGIKEPQSVLIPTAAMLADKINGVPEGGYRDLAEIRAELAAEHGTDITCPVTVRRHLRAIAAEALAAFETGKDAVPFWRVVDASRPGSEILAGGSRFIKARRAAEQN